MSPLYSSYHDAALGSSTNIGIKRITEGPQTRCIDPVARAADEHIEDSQVRLIWDKSDFWAWPATADEYCYTGKVLGVIDMARNSAHTWPDAYDFS